MNIIEITYNCFFNYSIHYTLSFSFSSFTRSIISSRQRSSKSCVMGSAGRIPNDYYFIT